MLLSELVHITVLSIFDMSLSDKANLDEIISLPLCITNFVVDENKLKQKTHCLPITIHFIICFREGFNKKNKKLCNFP